MARVRVGEVVAGAMAVLLTASAAWAQQGGAPDSGSTTPPAGSARPAKPLPATEDGQSNGDPSVVRSPSDLTRVISISGRVVLEDGTPPPDPVGIERVCDGAARPEGYTDSKGRFSIQLGRSHLTFADASVRADAGIRDLATCSLRASLGGYKSDEVALAGRRALDNSNVGTLVLRRYAHGEGDTVSYTSLAAPKEAAKDLKRGREAASREKWDEARKQFEKAVQLDPQYASAWCELGKALENLHDESGAWNAYQRAIASDKRFIPPYIQVANIELRRHDWAGAVETTDHIVRLDPVNFPGAYIYRSIAQFSLRDVEDAEKSARQALDLDAGHRFPVAYHVLAVILAQRGDLRGAAAHLKAYLRLAPNASDAPLARNRLARIERLARPTLPGTP